ncbi:MAG: transcriptional regulator [Chloroflexi bacterium]|nr:transcriptional regulator [Chloroflexota bacterium]
MSHSPINRQLSRAGRLRELENLLFRHPQGLKVTEIADRLQVTRRTIYRDLDLLSEANVPIWQDNGRFGIIRDQYLATIRLKFDEAVALYVAARLLARHADEHNPNIVAALNKLATAFPDPLATSIARTADAIADQPVNPTFLAVLEEITRCWADNRKVRVWYKSPRSGTIRQRDLSPYTIEPSSTGGLYVIGYDDWADDIRTFKLERLENAQRLTDTYTIPANFDPRAHFADAWGIMAGDSPTEIILCFSPRVSSYITERVWHPSQTLDPQADGSIYLKLHIAEPVEMRPWIRSWGSDVEVIAPQDLRDLIAEDVKRLAELYASSSSHVATT